jgi:hypothetical protein
MRTLLLTSIFALVVPLCAAAGDQPQQIRLSGLDKTPIVSGPFKMRIAKLSRSSLLGHGRGRIEVEVENSSVNPETFYPQRLSLVNRDNFQVNVLAARHTYNRTVPTYDPRLPFNLLDIRITPGARIKEVYTLSGRVRLPARLYYDDKLLAEIVE